MRRKAVVLAVFCLLVFAGGAHAVTLEQGWYAQIRGVDVYVYTDPYGSVELRGGASLDIQPGIYGPFRVTLDPVGGNSRVTVDVPTTASGVAPGACVEMPLMTGFSSVAYLGVDARTDYDASCMRLQLIQRDYGTGDVAVLWEQDQSGSYWHFQYMAYDATTAGLAFRVVAVPEPGGLVALLLPCSLSAMAWHRRRMNA